MARTRKQLVMTVTERWTFVFDDEADAPATAPAADAPALVPASSLLDDDLQVSLVEGADMVASPNSAVPADITTAGDDAV